jgi:transposase-like protein
MLELALKARGLNGVEFVVADDHAGLRELLHQHHPTTMAKLLNLTHTTCLSRPGC